MLRSSTLSPFSTLPAALVLALAGAGAQTAPPAPAPAPAPTTDAAALGFLRSTLDRKLYSLEGAGAFHLEGVARATFETTVRDKDVRPTSLELRLHCNYRTGEASAVPTQEPSADQKTVFPFAVAAAQSAFSWLPSRSASQWAVTLAQDGELVRLDYKSPQAAGKLGAGWSEWHRSDGTPVRRRVTSFRPAGTTGEKAEPVTQEIVPVFEEKKGRLLLVKLEPGDADGRFSNSFEYEEQAGFLVLKRLVQQNEGWRLTLEFKVTIERHDETGHDK